LHTTLSSINLFYLVLSALCKNGYIALNDFIFGFLKRAFAVWVFPFCRWGIHVIEEPKPN